MVIEKALRSIVALHAEIPEDGFTAASLGASRAGSGVVIRGDGLVLTIGYLITEAETIWLTTASGRVVAAHVVAYDQETGFGLVQALEPLDLPALALGDSHKAQLGDPVVLAGGERGQFVRAEIVGKQEFAGYWEYLLDEAIFTAPAHPLWGGAGLIGADGRLLGIGSLLVQSMVDSERRADVNMVVPIDLLPPILDDLLTLGRVNKPARPWLGLYVGESDDRVTVMGLSEKGPAAKAGVRRGDVVASVRDASVDGLADFYRKVWDSGDAGAEIPIEVIRDDRAMWVRVKSADRASNLKKPRLH